MPAVSVIIPVYNADKFLRKCLDSVVNQTLTDIEVICVDDCSTDSSLAILREYEKKDPRVKVIHCEQNRRQAVARNIGMSVATGQYIGFVDNDDWIDRERFKQLYHEAKDSNADIVWAGSTVLNENGYIESEVHHVKSKCICTGRHFMNQMLCGKIKGGEVWNGLYRSSFIRAIELCFQSIRSEDYFFTLEAASEAKIVCLLPTLGYYYLHRRDSDRLGKENESLYNIHGIEACIAYLEQNERLRNAIQKYDIYIHREVLFSFCVSILNLCALDTSVSIRQKCSIIKTWIKHPLLSKALKSRAAIKALPLNPYLMMCSLNGYSVPFVVIGLVIREYLKQKYHLLRGLER